jgi:antirestriction protein
MKRYKSLSPIKKSIKERYYASDLSYDYADYSNIELVRELDTLLSMPFDYESDMRLSVVRSELAHRGLSESKKIKESSREVKYTPDGPNDPWKVLSDYYRTYRNIEVKPVPRERGEFIVSPVNNPEDSELIDFGSGRNSIDWMQITGPIVTYTSNGSNVRSMFNLKTMSFIMESKKSKKIKEAKNTGPAVYVASLTDYNSGSEGKWIDLSKYTDGKQVMKDISDYLRDLTKKKKDGIVREEYAIHDFEGFPKSMYSEWMGEEDFDSVIEYIEFQDEVDAPENVINEFVDAYGGRDIDWSDMLDKWNDMYIGTFSDESDYAAYAIEEGLVSDSTLAGSLGMSKTDIRTFVSDEVDTFMDSNGFDEDDPEVDEYADEVEQQLERDPIQYFIDTGMFSDEIEMAKAILAGNFHYMYIDYKDLAQELAIEEVDYIRGTDGQTYVFSKR